MIRAEFHGATDAFRSAARSAVDVNALLAELCRVLVDVAGFSLAWVGIAEQDEARTVRPLARAGGSPSYVDDLRVSWSDGLSGRGPTGTAIREGVVCVNADSRETPGFGPWREKAERLGLRSSMAIPFEAPGGRAALSVYAAEPSAFDARTTEALAELVLELELRLHALHERLCRLRAEDALAETSTQLRHAQKLGALGQLSAGTAHDFKNLLSIAQLYIDALFPLARAPADRRAATEVTDALARAAKLCNQLLELGGPSCATRSRHDVNALVDVASGLFARALGSRIRLELRCAPIPLHAVVDPPALDQVLLNLVLNARDAMPDGGRLRIETGSTGRSVFVSVSDEGIGLAADVIAKVFDPYFTTKPRGRGTGLGLSVSRAIVEEHGGWIDVESMAGGSKFTVHLPPAGAPQAEGSSDDARGAASAPKTILVVEDNDALRWGIGRILRALGYAAVEVGTIADARAAAERLGDDLDVVLTDVVVPDGSGCDLVRDLVLRHPRLGAICMTGYGPSEIQRLEVPPGTHLLQKPFEKARLSEAIHACLAARAAGDLSPPHDE